MSIERTLASHYRDVEVDDPALQRLHSLIDNLSEDADAPAPRRLIAAAITTSIIAICVAGAAALVSHASSPRHAAGDPVEPGPVVTTNTGPGLPQKPGYIGVVNAEGVSGLIRAHDADDIAERGTTSIQGEARLDHARAHLIVALTLFDATGTHVIGQWNTADTKTTLPIDCPHRDGLAFRAPATGRSAHRTPLQAARALDTELNLAGLGTQHTTWTTTSRTAAAATLTNAAVTLHATATTRDTWVITSGQRCTT